MRIRKIELCNFGSYEDVNVFDTAGNSDQERIVIVGGKNGAGKTTLFTSILVCLYGHAAFGFKASGKLYLKEIFNLINSKVRMDETKTAYVRVAFTETRIDVDEYEILRSWVWSNGKITENVSISKNGTVLDAEQIIDFQNYLLHLIPPELLNLYFFDGEKIADFFLSEQHNNIKDALLILSGNDTYEILYNSVRKLLVGTESGAQNISQDYTDQKEAMRRYVQEEQQLRKVVAALSADLEERENALREENNAYSADGGISLDAWKELQKKLRDEEEKREKLNTELKQIAIDSLPFIIVLPLLKQVLEQIDTERELKTYQYLQKKLATHGFRNAILTTMGHLDSKDPSTDAEKILFAIQDYFRSSRMEKSKLLFDLSEEDAAHVMSTISLIEKFDVTSVARIRNEIEESIQRGKEIREFLQRSSIENYEEHIQQVSLLSADIERLKIQLEYAQKQFAENQESIDKLRKTLEQTRKTLEAELKKQSVSALSDRMMLLVEELQEQQYQKLLRSVEADLNGKFQQLIRKEGFVDHIYLDDVFGLHLIRNQEVEIQHLLETVRKHGIDALRQMLKTRAFEMLLSLLSTSEKGLKKSLELCEKKAFTLPLELDHQHFSNGEKQILVMALYWALMRQSKNELPFIIDTPFARIDTEHRANITKLLFKELNGQLFVLSTNEELRHEHVQALDEQIAKVYILEYGEDKRTSIIEGRYFEV